MTEHRLIVWNELLLEIAQVIGEAAVVQLCQALGGTRVYVPRLINPKHELALAIGQRAADRLAEHYHGTFLDLPMAYTRRARAIEMATDGGMTQKAAALATGYSQRHVRRLLNDARDDDEEQAELPF